MDERYRLALEAVKAARDEERVVVRFKAVGGAPVMKSNFFKIKAGYSVKALAGFLRKELGWRRDETLFLYIADAFAPEAEDRVGNLARCHGTSGHLIVTYAERAAWN